MLKNDIGTLASVFLTLRLDFLFNLNDYDIPPGDLGLGGAQSTTKTKITFFFQITWYEVFRTGISIFIVKRSAIDYPQHPNSPYLPLAYCFEWFGVCCLLECAN